MALQGIFIISFYLLTLSYFKKINVCHNHNVHMNKSECISVKGPKIWNDLPADIKLCKSMFTFFNVGLRSYTFAAVSMWLLVLFLFVCNDYRLSVS